MKKRKEETYDTACHLQNVEGGPFYFGPSKLRNGRVLPKIKNTQGNTPYYRMWPQE